MIKYEGKECKSFINKMMKMINGINKYNVESILLIQVYKNFDKFEPVVLSKPMDVDIFEYMKTIYSDNEIYNRSLEFMDMSKIKKKIDKLYYSPVIFSSLTPISFVKLTPEDLAKENMILPAKYSANAEYSDSYFIVTDLFKNFLKEREIYAVDEFMRFYDTDNCIYDTSAFVYKNEINKTFETKFVEETSPKHFLPMFLDEEDNVFINSKIKELLIKLNFATINRDMKEVMIIDKDVGVVSSDLSLAKLSESLGESGIFNIKDDSGFKQILTFAEFFKVNHKEVLFSKIDSEIIIDGERSPITYAGLSLRTKDFILYIFYKYFNYNEKE